MVAIHLCEFCELSSSISIYLCGNFVKFGVCVCVVENMKMCLIIEITKRMNKHVSSSREQWKVLRIVWFISLHENICKQSRISSRTNSSHFTQFYRVVPFTVTQSLRMPIEVHHHISVCLLEYTNWMHLKSLVLVYVNVRLRHCTPSNNITIEKITLIAVILMLFR